MATRDKKWRIQWGLIAEAQILDDTSQPMYVHVQFCSMHVLFRNEYSMENYNWTVKSKGKTLDRIVITMTKETIHDFSFI